MALSRSKRSMSLDARASGAAAILTRLAPSINILVENARPGGMTERGFGHEDARAANPAILW